MDKKRKPIDLSDWIDKSWALEEIPLQNNGWDCGVFMCQFASATVRNVSINFSFEDMPYIRWVGRGEQQGSHQSALPLRARAPEACASANASARGTLSSSPDLIRATRSSASIAPLRRRMVVELMNKELRDDPDA
jgi:hypothetical protein